MFKSQERRRSVGIRQYSLRLKVCMLEVGLISRPGRKGGKEGRKKGRKGKGREESLYVDGVTCQIIFVFCRIY